MIYRYDDALPSLVYNGVTAASPIGSSTTHTFNSVPLGAEHPTRQLLLCFPSNTVDSPTSVTVNGSAATLVRNGTSNGIGGIGIWRFAIPTGSTATVVRTFAGAIVGRRLFSVSAYHLKSTTPTDVASARVTNTSAAASANIDVLRNGVALGVTDDSDGSSPTWTGLTIADSVDPAPIITQTVAIAQRLAAATPLSISFAGGGTVNHVNIVTASFR